MPLPSGHAPRMAVASLAVSILLAASIASAQSHPTTQAGPQPTSTTLAAPAKLTCGDKLDLDATVTPVYEGEVTFFDGATDLGTVEVDETGHATFSVLHGLAKGAHSLTATFTPYQGGVDGSTSPAVAHEVNEVSSTLVLDAPENITCGSQLTMTATVTPASSGTVTFKDGLVTLGTVTVAGGVATLSIPSGLAAGAHSLQASYAPVASCSGPSASNVVAHTVSTIPTTLTLNSPTQGVCGQNFSLTASLSAVYAGTVRFFDGATQIGSAPLNGFGSASVVVSGGLQTGSHSLSATFTPMSPCVGGSVSETDVLTVQAAVTTVAVLSNRNPSAAGDMVPITVTVHPPTAQGTVELFDGATSLGTAPITQGAINFNPTFTEGVHSLTAKFTDGDCWLEDVSSVLVQNVVVPSISIADASVVEGDGGSSGLIFVVTMDAPLMNQQVTLHVKTFDGTADGGVDYTPLDQAFLIPQGQTSRVVFVPVVNDRIVEPNEDLTVVLSNADLATLVDSVATGTIVNDDVAVLSIANLTNVEGNQGPSLFVFSATLSKPVQGVASADWHTQDFEATIANGDYQAASSTLSFAPYDTATTFAVTVNGDSTFEPSERFRLVLENAVNLSTLPEALVTIQNDDGLPSIVIDDASIVEGDAGHQDLAFRVRLVSPSSNPVSVNYETLDATALANSDYLSTYGSLTIDPKTTEQVVLVRVFGDAACENPEETFNVRIFGPVGGVIHDNFARGTIVDQDCTAGILPGEVLPVLDLAPIRPNPARGAVRFAFALDQDGPLRLSIMDLMGREVARLADGERPRGRHEATWSGVGDRGSVAPGLYFARCRAAGRTITRPFVYTR